ncbi:glutamate racemase [Fontisphaera persica]|uniref:glutamate racemase n=1 Tax=Fontisphaera persica TaxID=2974023 RepID=UPI0024C0A2A1|nr:glutamate racemase [Fontisphaera persica]WCJ60135.1 glutamate racemase [Fontisphaera persica]
MSRRTARPIGIFDSGLGGLTVVRAFHQALPREDIVYLGDTARVPYGTKSPETVIRFACEDALFLERQKVKCVVVACNTASAWALNVLEEQFKVPVFGVIHPGARAAVEKTRNQRIGVIATAATIRSRAYQVAIAELDKKARVYAKACPLLVPLIEEGWTTHRITAEVLRVYLAPLLKEKIDTLILGCTHYPLIKHLIRRIAGPRVVLVDSAESCAELVSQRLAAEGLLQTQQTRPGRIYPYVTDAPEQFEALADRFLGFPIGQAWKVELPALKKR